MGTMDDGGEQRNSEDSADDRMAPVVAYKGKPIIGAFEEERRILLER
jgi:hypothetical protein